MNDDERIDFHRLEKELVLAVEADAKYDRENSAKFRAVEQKVGSYEEFRDIVSVAHLKPLDRKDITGEKSRKQPWNPHAHGKSQTNAMSGNPSQPLPAISKIPQNAHEFTKVWKRQCKTDDEKYQLLLNLGGQELGRIFKAEISMGFLGEFLFVLYSCLDDRSTQDVFDIIMQLSKTNRFDLSLKFLGEEEKTVTSKLIDRLEEIISERGYAARDSEDKKANNMEMLQELRTIYGVASSS